MSADHQLIRYQTPPTVYPPAVAPSSTRHIKTSGGPWWAGDGMIVATRNVPLYATPSVNLVISKESQYHKYVVTDPISGQPLTFIDLDRPADVIDDHKMASHGKNNSSSWSGNWRQNSDPYLVQSRPPQAIHHMCTHVGGHVQQIPQDVLVTRSPDVSAYHAVRTVPVDPSGIQYGYQTRVTNEAPYSYQSRDLSVGNFHGCRRPSGDVIWQA